MYPMQTFDFFHVVYCFFVRVALDPEYVQKIDAELSHGTPSKATKQLIQQVKTFHKLRASLCNSIRKHLHGSELLSVLAQSSGLKQYNSVPEQSTCIISGQTLTSTQGILLMVDGLKPYAIHVRYKNILYNFWFLAHLPQEIALETKRWFRQQQWWTQGQVNSFDACVERLATYQDKIFSKKMYVKLKGISKYIQTELSSLPINQSGQASS